MKHERTKTAVWWAVITLTVLFIWGQSLLRREMSAMQSEAVQGVLGNLFGERVYDSFFYQHIRKVAHFAEYALLGAEWMGYRMTVNVRRPAWWLLGVFGPAVAVCDELLQFISARAPMVTDVLLDSVGYAFGLAAVFGFVWLCRRCRVFSCRPDAVAIGFLLIELVLYVAILTVSGTAAVVCMITSVVVCFVYALVRSGRSDPLLVTALAMTVGADFFLVVCEPIEQLWGMVFFLAAQSVYAARLHHIAPSRAWLIVRAALIVAAVGITLFVLRGRTDVLALVSMAYYAMLIGSLLISATRFSRDRLLCIGFVLFLLCDTVVGLQVAADGYLPIAEGSWLYGLLHPGFNLAWLFYLPSQVCIAFSGRGERKNTLNAHVTAIGQKRH